MANFSNYLEEAILGHTLLGSSFTAPATVYLSLATSVASDGDQFTEVATGNAYARHLLNGNLTAPTSGNDWTVATSSNLTFTAATSDWGVVTHVGIHDSPTIGAGNLLYWGALDTSRTVNLSDVFEIQAGDMTVRLD